MFPTRRNSSGFANCATKSNQTVVHLEWALPMGADCPIFLQDMPNIFISLGNPYHLVDVPRMRTYINTYGATDEVLDELVAKLTGRSSFQGQEPRGCLLRQVGCSLNVNIFAGHGTLPCPAFFGAPIQEKLAEHTVQIQGVIPSAVIVNTPPGHCTTGFQIQTWI